MTLDGGCLLERGQLTSVHTTWVNDFLSPLTATEMGSPNPNISVLSAFLHWATSHVKANHGSKSFKREEIEYPTLMVIDLTSPNVCKHKAKTAEGILELEDGSGAMKHHLLDPPHPFPHELTAAMVTYLIPVWDRALQNSITEMYFKNGLFWSSS